MSILHRSAWQPRDGAQNPQVRPNAGGSPGYLRCVIFDVSADAYWRFIGLYSEPLAAQFADLADAQRRAATWCSVTAGLRVHGTTAQRPAEQFAAEEAAVLLPAPAQRYDVPMFAAPKVARDLHIEVARGLYSVPAELIGQHVDVRADSLLVKVFSGGQLVKTHPRVRPGGRSTDPGDYPAGRPEYALRDAATLTAKAAAAGPAVGVYAARLLDTPLPWTRMRTVYRLLGLVRSYGPAPVEAACARALELDVVDVTKIARMLEQATEHTPAAATAKVAGGPGRFTRDAAEFTVSGQVTR